MKTSTMSFLKVAIAVSLFACLPAWSHMMVAQHGTLNFHEDGAYMVLSLPVSCFANIDDDNDGLLSSQEFSAHRKFIMQSVMSGVTLHDENSKRPLEGLILSLAHSHHQSEAPVSQLIVMGRFALDEKYDAHRFQVNLFGENQDEKVLKITATNKQKALKSVFELTPNEHKSSLFN